MDKYEHDEFSVNDLDVVYAWLFAVVAVAGLVLLILPLLGD